MHISSPLTPMTCRVREGVEIVIINTSTVTSNWGPPKCEWDNSGRQSTLAVSHFKSLDDQQFPLQMHSTELTVKLIEKRILPVSSIHGFEIAYKQQQDTGWCLCVGLW